MIRAVGTRTRARPAKSTTESAEWRVNTRTVLFALGVVLSIWTIVHLQGAVIRVLLAIILSAGMSPLVDLLTVRRQFAGGRITYMPPRALVVLVLYLLLFAFIGLIGGLVLPPLVSEIEDLVRRLPSFVVDFQSWSGTLSDRYPFLPVLDFTQSLGEPLRAGAAQISGLLGRALVVVRLALSLLAGALNGIFILVLALYMTVDSDRIRRYLIGLLPPTRQEQAERVAGRIGERLGGWIRGQIMLSAIIGGVTLAGLWLIGVRYATLLAIIAAIGEAVPMVGPIFSAVPAVTIAFFQSPLHGGLTVGLYVLVQQLENHLIVPKVMERAVAIHPLAVMIALLAGAELLGVTGAVLSVPVAASLAVVIDEVRRERRERQERKAHLLQSNSPLPRRRMPVVHEEALLTSPRPG